MMPLLTCLSALCLFLACLGILSVFALYPFLLWLIARLGGERPVRRGEIEPSMSLIVVARNAEELIEGKLRNALALDYPREKLEVLFYSDGSTDRTVEIATAFVSRGVRLLAVDDHDGKAAGLNRAAAEARAEVLVFSDVDALLAPDALRRLAPWFADPDVGGVCGQRVIQREGARMKEAQKGYIRFDSRIKRLETALGSVTSNDGKLYAIRRELFQGVAPATTDDLYVCLSVIEQRRRFVFEPEAIARIRLPSRSPGHELRRRRRIVARSLWGLTLKRRLFNPFAHGAYGAGLFINKVVRRLLPVSFLMLLAGAGGLASASRPAALFLALQILGYLAALAYLPGERLAARLGKIGRLWSVAFYLCVGVAGTLLGLTDYLLGRRVDKWDPMKSDARDGGKPT